MNPRIGEVRAYIPTAGVGDYFEQQQGHWILDSLIANPMSGYADYRASRTSWGAKALGGLVIEIVLESGESGIGVSQGGTPAALIVEQHLARFLIGSDPRDLERLWDQMFRSTLPYGRKGLAICAISAVDLALWDVCGRFAASPYTNSWVVLPRKTYRAM